MSETTTENQKYNKLTSHDSNIPLIQENKP